MKSLHTSDCVWKNGEFGNGRMEDLEIKIDNSSYRLNFYQGKKNEIQHNS